METHCSLMYIFVSLVVCRCVPSSLANLRRCMGWPAYSVQWRGVETDRGGPPLLMTPFGESSVD